MAQQKQLIGHVKGDPGPSGPMGSLKSVEATVDNAEGVPSVDASIEGDPGNQTLKLDFHNLKGEQGATAAKGATFTPSVDEEGYLNWTNDQELPNPEKVLIKGPKGDTGTISEFTVNVDDTHLDQPTASVQMAGEPGNQTITVDIKGLQGKPGETGAQGPASFGEITADVVDDGGEASVEVEKSGDPSAPDLVFHFRNMGGGAVLDAHDLDIALAAAEAAKQDVKTSDQEGEDLEAGDTYVTTEEMSTFEAAIAAAQKVRKSARKQEQIEEATQTLTEATSTFTQAIKTNLTIPQSPEDFNAMSWKEISKLSTMAATSPDQFMHMVNSGVDYEKDVEISGVGAAKILVIGVCHDDLVDGGKAGLTLQITDGLSTSVPANFQMNGSDDNTGGWEASLMRSENLPKLKAALPEELQPLIKKVRKKTGTANSGTEVSETEDDLFLLSLVESLGTTKTAYSDNPVSESNYLYNEGSQYEYYKQFDSDKTEAFNHHIIKNSGGSAQGWWLRSVYLGDATSFWVMGSSGDWGVGGASGSYLPAAGFCL